MKEDEEQSLNKIKDHFNRYKTIYISAGVIVLSIGIGIVIGKNINITEAGQELIIKAESISDSPIINNSTITQNNFQGRQTKIVECIETGSIWSSITSAAEDIGVSFDTLSKVINGKRPDINGQHFRVIGLGTDA